VAFPILLVVFCFGYEFGPSPPFHNHTYGRRSIHRETIACSLCYEQIITPLASRIKTVTGVTCLSSPPHVVLIMVSQVGSGVNIDTVMGIAIGYPCITCGGNFWGPVPDAGRRPIIVWSVEVMKPTISSCPRYRLPTSRDPKRLTSLMYPFYSLPILTCAVRVLAPPAPLRPTLVRQYSAASCRSMCHDCVGV
jgi:hypothetical protein